MHLMKPTWRHDCDACRFLGAIHRSTGTVDWYRCEGRDKSIVARRSDDGPDYWSMPESMVADDMYLTVRYMDSDNVGYSEMVLLARFMLNNKE